MSNSVGLIQALEIWTYTSLRWFYQQPGWMGVLLFGAPGLALLFIQFQKRSKAHIPGIFGVGLISAAALHLFKSADVVAYFNEALATIENYRSPYPGLGPLEPFFHVLVGPAGSRFLYQEAIAVGATLYFISLAILSYREYKKTGIIVGDLGLAVFGSKVKRPKRSQTNELGSGDLASAEQIAKWSKPNPATLETALNVSELRGGDGAVFRNTKLVLPSEERNRHVLVIAKTGSGKTSQVILPVLYNDCLDPERTSICIDSKPEMWSKLAGLTAKYNPDKKIILFNPLDTARTLGWNILSKIEDDTDAKLIANTIIMATDQPQAKSDSPFFRNNALQILNAIMVGLLNDPNDTLSMPRVHELVQSGMKPLCEWLESHPHALRTTRTFVELSRSGSQNADTIMSELSMRLNAWDLPAIRATTAQSEFDLEELITKPCLFIVELRESELEMLRPMANVIVVELLRFLTKYAERCPNVRLPRPVGLVIDEFASALGRLPDIHVKLNTLRSRNVSIVAAIQSINQIKANYGEHADSVLAGFSSKILMPTLDIQDSEWASKETGQMTIRFQTQSTGSNKKLIEFFASKNDSTQEQVQQRAVLTPDEIGRPRDNVTTFFMPNTPVFQGHIIPFFKIPEMDKRIRESSKHEFRLRDKPIEFAEKLPEAAAAPAAGAAAGVGGLPPGITNTQGWTPEQVNSKLEETKHKLDWENTTGSARKWWEAFENENKHRMALVLRLAEELANRKATITEFFLAYVYSNTDNIQANLCYLDYTRLKKEEERKRKEAAQKARESQQSSTETAPPSKQAAA